MENLEALVAKLPDAAKDLRLNLTNVLQSETLTPEQRWGVALASAYYLRDDQLIAAVKADATTAVDENVLDDAQAAAALMGMNTIFYRFRYMVGKDSYGHRPAQLRMTRMKQVKTNAGDFELYSLAVAVLAGCQLCVQSHEASITKEGLSEAHVHDAVRIASTLSGVAVALHIA